MTKELTIRWARVKHVPDLLRKEPINIGVLVFSENKILSRFLTEDEPKSHFIKNEDLYKSWVTYWKHVIKCGMAGDCSSQKGWSESGPFYVEHGGTEEMPEDLETYLDDLYEKVVTIC